MKRKIMFAVILSVQFFFTYSYALDNSVLFKQHKLVPDVTGVALERRGQNDISDLLSECEAMFNHLSFTVLNYSKCVVDHSLSSNVCSNCVSQFNEASTLYETDFGAMYDDFGQRCSDRMNVSAGTQMKDETRNYVQNSWNTLHCDGCFANQSSASGHLVPEYAEFFEKFKLLTVCIHQSTYGAVDIKLFGPLNYTTNHSVCIDCSARQYKELDSIYFKFEMMNATSNKVCQDIGDVMNYTRYVWRDIFGCKSKPKDNALLWVVSAFLAVLPVTFYIASYLNGSDVSKKLVRQKRLQDCAALPDSSSCQ